MEAMPYIALVEVGETLIAKLQDTSEVKYKFVNN